MIEEKTANLEKEKFDILLFLAMFCAFSLYSFSLVLVSLGFPNWILTYKNYIQVIVYLFLGLKFLFRGSIPLKWSVVNVCYIILLVVSKLLYADRETYIHDMFMEYFTSILPIMITVLYCGSYGKYLHYLRYVSYFAVTRIFFTPFSSAEIFTEIAGGAMAMSYGTIVPWAVITYFAFKENKVIDICVAISSGIIDVIFGTRGVILCITCFLLYEISHIENRKRKRFLVGITIVVGLGLFLFYLPLLTILYNWVSASNYSSKILRIAMTKGLSFDNGRYMIWRSMINSIGDHLIIGSGIAADRIISGTGAYAHNLLLELCVDFGVVIGLGLFVTFLITMFKTLFDKDIDSYMQQLYAIFVIPGFVMLMISGSVYLTYMLAAALTVSQVNACARFIFKVKKQG